MVKRMEVCGARSGKPSRRVHIADCGQVRDAARACMHACCLLQQLPAPCVLAMQGQCSRWLSIPCARQALRLVRRPRVNPWLAAPHPPPSLK